MLSVLNPDLCKRISELDRISRLSSDSKFILSRLNGTTDAVHAILCNERTYTQFLKYVSRKVDDKTDPLQLSDAYNMLTQIRRESYYISYSDMSADMTNKLCSMFNFHDMAYESKDDYAKVGHEHGYTRVRISPTTPFETAIGKFSIGNSQRTTHLSVGVPKFIQPTYTLNIVGDVKFIAKNNRKQISYTDKNFDGWVYADGARYPKDRFPDAYEIYKGMSGSNATSFVVPIISNFILPDPFCDDTVLSVQPFRNSLRSHTHTDIDQEQLSGAKFQDVSLKIPIKYYNLGGTSAGSNGIQHTGHDKQVDTIDYTLSVNLNNTNTVATVTNSIGGTDAESYPEYIDLPVMIYIGGESNVD